MIILVIGYSDTVKNRLKDIFTGGHQVLTCRTYPEATELFAKTKIDLVVGSPLDFRENAPFNWGQTSLEEATGRLECQIVTAAMEKTNYNQTQAASLLKVTRGALQYKLKKYAIAPSKIKKAA